MKIENLEKINVLQEKCHLLYPIDSFYDKYWKNDIEWLIINEERINNDFEKNKSKFKFDIILNCKFINNTSEILSLKNASIEEFSNYICFVPFKMSHKKEQSYVMKKFDIFKSISDEWSSVEYFNRIKR